MSKEYVTEHIGKEDFLKLAVRYNPNANIERIRKAYEFAEVSHRGQKRLCGKDYFMHCKEVAYMLMKLSLDTATICAALLHDVLEDTTKRSDEIKRQFGEEILYLVSSVTKIKSINIAKEEERAENIMKVLLATIKDIRVILIKLADRLHNMRTLKYMDELHRKYVARETLDIYVPIAYKLGMYRIKSEMEDICLRYINPEVYQELKRKISKKKEEREKDVRTIITYVKHLLSQKGFKATITGRAKNFYGIYKKMTKKGIPFENIHDLSAIRIITETGDDCYRILGLIHSTWTPIVQKFDDYIASPKQNMYQSLHTEVMINGRPTEVQIRTWKMHHIAEEGIAAHWRYKDTEKDKRFDRRIAWLKQILEWRISSNAKDFVESLKIDLFKDEIYTITPKGDVIPLPEKSTPVDFAYAVHTDIGNHCSRAKVNGNIVPLDYELKSGDVVEIITLKSASPSRNWLKFVKTSLGKAKIRHELSISVAEDQQQEKDTEDIISLIKFPKKSLLKVAGCCSPQDAESIMGYKMKDGKIAVHRTTCENIKQLNIKQRHANKILSLEWETPETNNIILRTEVTDRIGLFQEILNVMTQNGIKIESINTKSTKDKLYLLLEVKPTELLGKAINAVRRIKNVIDVKVDG